MKIPTLTASFLIAGTLVGSTQGVVLFDNNPYLFSDSIEMGGTVDRKIYACDLVTDALWTAQLWQSGQPLGNPLHFYGESFPGVWSTLDDTSGGNRVLLTPGGVPTVLEVRFFGPEGHLQGASMPFSYTPPRSPTALPEEFFMKNFRSWPCPEPATPALVMLGVGGWWLMRRWQR